MQTSTPPLLSDPLPPFTHAVDMPRKNQTAPQKVEFTAICLTLLPE
jgi:hypothetical protein